MQNYVLTSFFAVLLFSLSGAAIDIDWTGKYRLEGTDVRNYDLDKNEKNYFLHHLILNPSIIATDDLEINFRFDIANSADYGGFTNQVGQFLGNTASAETSTNINSQTSDQIAQTMGLETIANTLLYLNWHTEYGSIAGGRLPKQFGLGTVYSAGKGSFDHWLDTHDVVSLQMLAGNHTITPSYGKINEGLTNERDDTTITSLQYDYEYPETKLKISILWEVINSDDSVATDFTGTTGSSISGSYSMENKLLYFSRAYGDWDLALEFAQQDGDTGIFVGAQEISMSGTGLAIEAGYKLSPNLKFEGRFGYASGDDINTTDKYEGFQFDRNYDVALLLFNHRLGTTDFLKTESIGGSTTGGVDTEYISNAIYLAPKLVYQTSDKWTFDTSLIYATLHDGVLDSSVSKDLGLEIDFGMSYFHNPQTELRAEFGYLFAGEAFAGNTSQPTTNSYIISTKAAISF
ncbi:MAG: hypothetical protein AB8E15_01235 [Bdellovibrionales bacterium]